MLQIVDGWYLWLPVLFLAGAHNALPVPNGSSGLADYLLRIEAGYVVPLFVGLMFTALDDCRVLRDATDACVVMAFSKMQPRHVFVVALVVGLGVGALVPQFVMLYREGRLLWLLAGYGVFFVLIGIVGFLVRTTHSLHLHHYIIFGLLVPLFGLRNWYSCVLEGICVGVVIEGLDRWCMDPLFEEVCRLPVTVRPDPHSVGPPPDRLEAERNIG